MFCSIKFINETTPGGYNLPLWKFDFIFEKCLTIKKREDER
jgi:hypothetical protein